MRMDRLTTLAQQAIADAQSASMSHSHAEVGTLHLLSGCWRTRTAWWGRS